MRATVSLLGLYNYDPTVLDGLTLPENFSSGDIEILKNNLLMETAELELLYTDPNFLKFAITNWCNKNRPTWKWLYDTQHYEYNPIWNVDYHQSDRTDTTNKNVGTSTNTNNFTRELNESEDTTDRMDYASQMAHNFNSELERAYDSETERAYDSDLERNYNSTLTKTYAGTAKEEHSGDTDTETRNHIIEKSGSETTEHSVSAYNQSNAYHPESKDEHSFNNYKDTENGHVIFNDNITIDNSTNFTDTDVHTGKDTDTHSGKDTDTHSGKDTDTHTGADTDVHSGSDTRTIDRDLSQTGGTTTTDNGRTTSDTDTNVKYEKYLRGNYGQTTQDMINQEQELAKKNIFDYIICDFKKRFNVMVY